MQIWAESGKSALPICNYSQILYQFLTFTQNLKRSRLWSEKTEITYFVSTLLRSEPVLLCDYLAYCSVAYVVGMGIRISYKDFED